MGQCCTCGGGSGSRGPEERALVESIVPNPGFVEHPRHGRGSATVKSSNRSSDIPDAFNSLKVPTNPTNEEVISKPQTCPVDKQAVPGLDQLQWTRGCQNRDELSNLHSGRGAGRHNKQLEPRQPPHMPQGVDKSGHDHVQLDVVCETESSEQIRREEQLAKTCQDHTSLHATSSARTNNNENMETVPTRRPDTHKNPVETRGGHLQWCEHVDQKIDQDVGRRNQDGADPSDSMGRYQRHAMVHVQARLRALELDRGSGSANGNGFCKESTFQGAALARPEDSQRVALVHKHGRQQDMGKSLGQRANPVLLGSPTNCLCEDPKAACISPRSQGEAMKPQ